MSALYRGDCACGCGEPVISHQASARFRHGHWAKLRSKAIPLADRFWAKVDKAGWCWEWKGLVTVGYSWRCGCGLVGKGEAAAMRHARTCPLFGRPWTNPDYPKPEAAA